MFKILELKNAVSGQEQKRVPRTRGFGKRPGLFGESEFRQRLKASAQARDSAGAGATQRALIIPARRPTMFKILELKNAVSAPASEVGRGFSTREEALVAVKRHLKTFNVSGHNPEGDYWWARDAEGLRKCWIASAE